MRFPAKTWLEYFKNVAQKNYSGNDNLEVYSNAANPTKLNQNERIKALTEEQDAIVLLANAMKNITIIHSVKDLGGTRSRPENKIVALQGFSNDAVVIIIDKESTTQALELKTPPATDIADCESADLIKNLRVPTATRNATDKRNFLCTLIYFPSPWETETILNSESKDCHDLTFALIQAKTKNPKHPNM
jgi:hypothetical protein